MTTEVLRYTAFSHDPDGGNPAGVVLDAAGLDDSAMLEIAAGLGYSETAFLTAPPEGFGGPQVEGRAFTVRYFSPKAEVPFCGHATVATAVALAERIGPGEILLATRAGTVPVSVTSEGGQLRATLTSVEPHTEEIDAADLAEALAALDWPEADLDPAIPPAIAYAGARHLVLGAATRARLADLAYDFARLEALMRRLDLTTVQLVHRAARRSSTYGTLPGRRSGRGPRHGSRRGRLRRVRPRTRPGPGGRRAHPPPGRGHGPPRAAHRGTARR